jgi:hypothetical protein
MSDKRYIFNPTFRPSVVFTTRLRSQEIRPMQIDATVLPQMANLLLTISAARKEHDFADRFAAHTPFLTQAGILIDPDAVTRDVQPLFPLSKTLLNLVPRKSRVDVRSRDVRINRENVFVQKTTPRPKAHRPGIPPWTGFPKELPLVWVFDPRTEMWAAYHADQQMAEQVENLQSLEDVEDDTAELLYQARIVVDVDDKRDSIAQVDAGIGVLRDVISPLQIAAARSYARALESEGYLQLDHEDVKEKRFFKHNDELFRFLHRQTGYLLRRVTGEMIIPSFTYLSAYCEGAALPRHKDRPQCVWNASLLIDTNREDDDGRTWPICLEMPEGTREVRLDLGDAIVYHGAEIPHWRPEATNGDRQSLVLMHYVPFDFTGSLD